MYRIRRPKYHYAKRQDIVKKQQFKLSRLCIAILKFPTTLHMVCPFYNFTLYTSFFLLTLFTYILPMLSVFTVISIVYENFSWDRYQVCHFVNLSSLKFHGESVDTLFSFYYLKAANHSANYNLSLSTCTHLLDNEHNESTEKDVADFFNPMFSYE